MPFFRGLALGERYELVDCVPRRLGELAADGSVTAGLLPLADGFRLQQQFERLGHFGIAVRGRARSVLLFSTKPIRQLDGAVIAVTEETSTTALLLRVILEQRYRLKPAAYHRGQWPDADALLLIGDGALRFRQSNRHFPFEIDLAFEWWVWQHLPFVFALWAVRRDADAQDKRHIESSVARALSQNLPELSAIAKEHAPAFGMPVEEVETYLASFTYRLGPSEEEGITRFKELIGAAHLL